MSALSLAYVGLGVTEVPAWARFATEVLQLEEGTADPHGARMLRLDRRSWRIGVHQDERNDLIYVGFEVPDVSEAQRIAYVLAADGAVARTMSREMTASRRVRGGFMFEDPDGLAVEVVYGHEDGSASKLARESVFVTGSQGLGHVVISTSDAARSIQFYGKLGFSISDYIDMEVPEAGRVRLVFLHCNERHHSLALLPLPTPKRLNHLMLEVRTVDSVLTAYYRAQKLGVPIVRHVGRHTNDQMLSFYARTPAGFDVECGCGGIPVGSDWQVKEYDAISLWGHEP